MQLKLLAALAAAAGLAACSPKSGDVETIKIGHVGPVSGPQAHYGKDNENGARMAIDDLNAQSITIGGKKVKFEMLAEDDGAVPAQGAAVAQKLCDAKVNGVVGHLNSGTTMPASRIYAECGIPEITPAATNPKYSQQGFKTAFRVIANDDALGAGLAVHAAKAMKLTKIAVIDDRTAYGQGVAEVFKKTALANGIQIVDEQYTTDKATDFMAILTSIKSKTPDGVFYGGMDPQAGPLLRQMDQLNLTAVKVFGGDGICTEKLTDLSAKAKTLDNVVCAVGGASLDKMPKGKEWKARYDAKYPGQFQVYSPYVYDAVMVLVDAMKRADSSDPKVYGPKLFETNYTGVTAQVVFEPNGELKDPAMTLYSFKDGVKVPIE